MSLLRELVLAELPLQDTQLIEASAGTGKTHTVTGLYMRLLLEAGLRVDEVLVVTYTKAATAELRRRIRERLVGVGEWLGAGRGEDALAQAPIATAQEPVRACASLRAAVADLDQAPIYTIHGFCQRALRECAFEARQPFETVLVPEGRALLAEAVQDFWRRELYQGSPRFVRYVLARVGGPERLTAFVEPYASKPYLRLAAAGDAGDWEAVEARYAEARGAARRLWDTSRAELEALLARSTALNRNRCRPEAVPQWCAALEEWLRDEHAIPPGDELDRFTAPWLASATKRGHSPPEHPFFAACEVLKGAAAALEGALRRRLSEVLRRLILACRSEGARQRWERRLQTYDGLLLDLDRALSGAEGARLAERLRGQYRAALIDEFQDTDPVQYRIFESLYRGTGCPLFIVGDPKQAIYSFRGADVFVYLRGRRAAAGTHALSRNWRSDPSLVQAINAVFARAKRPFLIEEIGYQPLVPAETHRPSLHLEGQEAPPFVVWFLASGPDGRPIDKGEAREQAARATAAEVGRLLRLAASGRARVGERALAGGDIAVLVRTHSEGRRVRRELAALGIPSVLQGAGDVFQCEEATELERVLQAIHAPEAEGLVRAALSTRLMGRSAGDLDALGRDDAAWEACLQGFFAYHRLWVDHGFAPMWRRLVEREAVMARLLAHAFGPRRATNLLHLAELTQRQERQSGQGPEGLLKWLGRERRAAASREDERLLRLESDEHLVQVMTVHAAKGLEFPIVFCPFLWDGGRSASGDVPVYYHDPDAGYEAVLDLGSARHDEARRLAEREAQAEVMRLCYVALTRARHRTYLLWGRIKEAERSALHRLLHPASEDRSVGVRQSPGEGDPMRADLEDLARAAEGSIAIEPVPGSEGPRVVLQEPAGELRARTFPGAVPSGFRVTSYSALARSAQVEAGDRDGHTAAAPSMLTGEGHGIFAFPRGVQAGRCLHAILERLDFNAVDPAGLDGLISAALSEEGIAEEWKPVLHAHLQGVLATPLDEMRRLRLGGLDARRCLKELKFHYAIARLEPEAITELLREAGVCGQLESQGAQEGRLCAAPRGFMTGYIDLLFEHEGRYFLADYKSNWLGPAPSDYQCNRLPAVMEREGYHFQYLIYTVALHRYLSRRLRGYDYERHAGGIYYLFLRGMDPLAGPEQGVYFHKPEASLVARLDEHLGGGFPWQPVGDTEQRGPEEGP